MVPSTGAKKPPAETGRPSSDRQNQADLWEAGANERERLADERERVADEREGLADERERLADRHDRALDRRLADWRELASSAGVLDEDLERSDTLAALDRAESAVARAEAELVRVRLAADRLVARSDLRAARVARTDSAGQRAAAVGPEEQVWLDERRDFVAAERDTRGDERDRLADERDEEAARRERLADERERGALSRERRMDHRGPLVRSTRADLDADSDELRTRSELRARADQRREAAGARRRIDAQERVRAAAAWGPAAYGPRLVASFADLAKQLFVSEELSDVLPQLLKFTVNAVAGCDWASVTLWRHGRVVDTVATSAIAAELDELQFGTELGPALDALQEDQPIYSGRLAESAHWPVLAETAAQLGVASVLSHGLFVHRSAHWSALGTFNLYGAAPDAFGDEDQEFGSILAAYLSVAVAMAQRSDEIDRREAALHRGLSTRDVIGQAKGILMERQRLSAGEAFDVLRRASQRLNLKVADIASHLADTGELP